MCDVISSEEFEPSGSPMTGDEFLAWLEAATDNDSVIHSKEEFLREYRRVHGNPFEA